MNLEVLAKNEEFCKLAYKQMHKHPLPICWGCGQNWFRPKWWFAPWMIERAHIVNKPRKEDRRAAICLCSECHKQSHGEKFTEGQGLQAISQANMIWLKKRFDPLFFDLEFMQRCSIRILPAMEPLCQDRLSRLDKRAGSMLNIGRKCWEQEFLEIAKSGTKRQRKIFEVMQNI